MDRVGGKRKGEEEKRKGERMERAGQSKRKEEKEGDE